MVITYILGAEEERDLIKSIKYKIQSIGDNTHLYITIESMKKRKPKTLNSDPKQILNPTWKPLRDQTLSTCLLAYQTEPVCTTPDFRDKPVDSHGGPVDSAL